MCKFRPDVHSSSNATNTRRTVIEVDTVDPNGSGFLHIEPELAMAWVVV